MKKMIRVFDKWVVDSDGRQFTCGELDTTKVKIKLDNGEEGYEDREYIKNPMYHTTFSGCLQALSRRLRQKAIKSMNGSLEDAIAAIQAVDKRLIDAMGVISSLTFDNVNEHVKDVVNEQDNKQDNTQDSPDPASEKPKRGRKKKVS